MNFNNVLAAVAVRDIEASILWYQDLIGHPPDSRPLHRAAGWKFPAGGWMELFESAERAGFSTVIIAVHSLEEQWKVLAEKGIEARRVSEPEYGEVAIASDPDGNQVVFAGPLSGVLDD